MRHRGARRVGRRDPPPLSSPTRGEDAQRSDPRVKSRAEGAKAPNCESMAIRAKNSAVLPRP